MHRLPSALIEPEHAEWRPHHAEQGGCHDTISCLLHQQSNSNCYRFFRMSLKYMYSSLARAEPTHRCASNAPISPAHVRICHKTKASKRNFLLHPLVVSGVKCAFCGLCIPAYGFTIRRRCARDLISESLVSSAPHDTAHWHASRLTLQQW